MVIVDDADHLDPTLLASLVEQAAVRTNTKLLLITKPRSRGTDCSVGDGVAGTWQLGWIAESHAPMEWHRAARRHHEQPFVSFSGGQTVPSSEP